MAVTECCLKYTTVKEKENSIISAIIVCGGSSQRMNGVDKIFAEINGIPVAARAISAFQKCSQINNIVIVVKDENIFKMQRLCEEYRFDKVTDIVAGGGCRQESVANGLSMLTYDTDYVLIHDGARPLVSEGCIMRVIDGAVKFSAVTCAVKLKDTVKVVKPDGMVTATPDRNTLAAVQTPQGFSYELYKRAVEDKNGELDNFTDDCSVVESFGYPVYIVDGDYTNIKITTAEDLDYASYLAGKEDK